MSLSSLLKYGKFVIGSLLAGSCLINTVQAQPGGGASTVPTRSSVVAGIAGETTPITRKKYVGNIEAIEEVDSIARVSGTLTVAPGFEEGSHVTKGQLLFEIDPIPYQAKVDAAQATIKQLEAKIDYAEKNFKRVNDLYARNAGSKNDMESAESDLLSLRAELLAAQAQLVLAKEDLGYTQIKSAIDGRAGRRAYSTGNYVTATSSPLVKVVQTDPIYVRFTMSERDYLSMYKNFNELKTKSTLQLKLPNDETYPIEGEISFIDNTVKSTTDTIKVWAKFSNPDEILNPGGVVTVNLSKHEEERTATIKPSAVMFDGEKNYVYVLVNSIEDGELYQEIKSDARFALTIEIMESALNAILGDSEKIDEFLVKYKENMVVAQFEPAISEALASSNQEKAQEELVKLASSLGKVKVFNGIEISSNPQDAIVELSSSGLDAWIKSYLDAFKAERYVYTDPQTHEKQDDFSNNKVNEKYMMVLRRDVTLGPSGDNIETLTSGVKPNEIVMIDGVHKARPFDLVIPVYKDKQTEIKNVVTKQVKASSTANSSRSPKVKGSTGTKTQEAKRISSTKKVVVTLSVAGDAAV